MKIVIIGKDSFIGRNFIAKYCNDYDIIEYDIKKKGIDSLQLEGVDVVVHLAAIVHQSKSIPEDTYYRVNSDLAFDIANKANKEGVKQFLFFSTVKVFGDITRDQEIWTEDSVCNPVGHYAQSKLQAENRIKKLNSEDFIVTIIRPCLVYGPGVKANMFSLIKLVDRLYMMPFGGLKNIRNMVYVENLVLLANKTILNSAPGIYIGSDGTDVNIESLMKSLAEILDKKRLFFAFPWWAIRLFSKSVYTKITSNMRVNPSKGYGELGFTPEYSLFQGLQDTILWYKSTK